MPIYEYRCASCGHTLDTIQKVAEAPLTDCPACQRPELKKQITAAGFQLKGSGWYATDFKNSGSKPTPASESSSESSSSTETVSDNKPKTDSKPKAGGCSNGSCGCG